MQFARAGAICCLLFQLARGVVSNRCCPSLLRCRYRHTELESAGESAVEAAADAGGGAAAGAAAGGDGGAAAAAAAGAATGAGTEDACHTERDAEYGGETVVQWGDKNFKDSAAECCAACQALAPKCNVWVYCGKQRFSFSCISCCSAACTTPLPPLHLASALLPGCCCCCRAAAPEESSLSTLPARLAVLPLCCRAVQRLQRRPRAPRVLAEARSQPEPSGTPRRPLRRCALVLCLLAWPEAACRAAASSGRVSKRHCEQLPCLQRQCSLAQASAQPHPLSPCRPPGTRLHNAAAGSGWVSGAVYTAAEKDAALAKAAAAGNVEREYLEGLRRNESLPVGAGGCVDACRWQRQRALHASGCAKHGPKPAGAGAKAGRCAAAGFGDRSQRLSAPQRAASLCPPPAPPRLPQLVFLDVEIKQRRAGRIEMVLFPHISPRAAENFRRGAALR